MMRLTKRNQLKLPKELREEERVIITKSSRPNTLLMFSPKSWIIFSEKLSETCKDGCEKKPNGEWVLEDEEERRWVRRHYFVPATELWPDSQNYVCIGHNEDLLDWFCDRPEISYEISYRKDDDCYLFINSSVKNDDTIERSLP